MHIRTTLLAAVALLSSAVLADSPKPQVKDAQAGSTVSVAAGEHYKAGPIWRLLLGSNWREAWTTPVQVPVLDLATFDGGMTPEKLGGGEETKNLHFKSANGNTWAFRSVDKDPTRTLDAETARSLLGELFQDGVSCAHPYGALMVGPLLDAVGVLHPTPQLFVLPDDPKMGKFRELAGMLGLMEERFEKKIPDATKVDDTVELFQRMEEKTDESIDARNYLHARLIDILVGDWDRHILQWRWVRFEVDGKKVWKPVPRDRDQAFSEVNGIGPRVASYYTKQLVGFGHSYAAIDKSTFSGKYIDRRFLNQLSRKDFEEVGADVRAKITDQVISTAVHELPDPIYALEGAAIEATLRHRRDGIEEQARDFYELLANQVEVRATTGDDEIHAARAENGDVALTLAPKDPKTNAPYFSRTFSAGDTSEIRIHTLGGKDQVIVDGSGNDKILLRVVEPKDVPADLKGDASVYTELTDPPPEASWVKRLGKDEGAIYSHYTPSREWGHDLLFYPQFSYDSTRGLVLGAFATLTTYGFEYRPDESVQNFGAAYSTGRERPRIEYGADFRTRTPLSVLLYLSYSGIETTNYFGLGNDTPRNSTLAGQNFYQVHQDQIIANPMLDVPLFWLIHGRIGVLFKHAGEATGGEVAELEPAGSNGTTLGSGQADLVLDTRKGTYPHRNGFHIQLTARHAPDIFSNPHQFTKLRGTIDGVVSGNPFLEMMFVARIAGERNWGHYPFFESAFLGGGTQASVLDVTGAASGNLLRGYDLDRFAGDSSLVGNSELQITLFRFNPGLPLRFGLVGLCDVGRVFLAGETSNTWHSGYGGGVWLGLFAATEDLAIASAIQATIVHSDNGPASFYIYSGFGF